MNKHHISLEFPAIIEKLKTHALSEKARAALDNLSPCLSEDICRQKMAETTSARTLLDSLGSPPLSLMENLDESLTLAKAGGMLIPGQLSSILAFSASCKRMASYLARGEASGECVAAYGRSIESLSSLQSELEGCISGGELRDDASALLKQIRRKKDHVEQQIKEKLSQILQSRKQYLAEAFITNRQGHYVIPVQRKYQSMFEGSVIESSGRGGTVFMEPACVTKYQSELSALSIEEDGEMRRILYTLTALVADNARSIERNMEAMEILDVLFAKAKLSSAMQARPVEIGGQRRIDIRQGRHPLLASGDCVPLDFKMEGDIYGVIITGPNTGGKTVALKTVGLFSLMAQCGLHIPCGEGSYIAMQDNYLCDIGDSQNITANLSTFSGHMTNVISILEGASRDSLVLLDELGSGTDPAEGMGIAVAVLEELRRRGCMFLVTTHYPQVKDYAERAQGIVSARMAFDKESLEPLYRLEMGKSGESCALDIAARLGLAPGIIARARREVYGGAQQEASEEPAMKAPKSSLVRHIEKRVAADLSQKFQMGDSVVCSPSGELGIVYKGADENGDVIVQVKGVKRAVKHNRLTLKVPAHELYPPDYDFSIIFDSVEVRKARHQMDRKFDPSISISYD